MMSMSMQKVQTILDSGDPKQIAKMARQALALAVRVEPLEASRYRSQSLPVNPNMIDYDM